MKTIRKALALVLALCIVLSLAACGSQGSNESKAPDPTKEPDQTQTQSPETPPAGDEVAKEITIWIYPVGGWSDEKNVKPLLDKFTADTGIAVKYEFLAYADGDDKVNTSFTSGGTPDLIMEGPERLVVNWGAKGKMVDLTDMIDATDKSELNEAALAACTSPDGKVLEYPMFITAHCMAINLDAFKEAGADQYIDLETRTWSTENFFKAVDALYAKYNDTVAAVFCKGQGGDQGTRALINNLYGGKFTNADHSQYTWDDPNNIKALEALKEKDGKGIAFDASLEGGDELKLLYQDVLKMAFCWNVAQQLDPASQHGDPGKTMGGSEIVCMNFPTESGKAAELCGGIWGLGIFDNGDPARIAASKQFIKYMCDSENAADAAKISNFFSARSAAEGTDLSNIFADNDIMNEYNKIFLPSLGEYYNVVPGWAQARTSWWNMLQKIGTGEPIADTVATYMAEANAAAAG